jgi:uncharacterized protein
MTSLTIGDHIQDRGKLRVDLGRLVETRMLIQANSGGGKSYAIRKLLEETHGKVQQIVLDVEGEFATLRERFDYILAGRGGDIPADPNSAELLARKILELDTSLIVDLYELKMHERHRFVRVFLDSLVNSPKELWHPVLILIDEAHLFAPEKGESEAMSAVVDLATRGRKRGFAAILATQRLSKLHKDVAAECLNKLIGRTGLDIDMKRASEELGFASKQQMLGLRDLEPGQFFAFGPALTKAVSLAQISKVETSHPKAGQRLKLRVPVPTAKVKRILAKLTDLPKEAEQELRDRRELQMRLRELERELRKKASGEVDEKHLAELEARAFERGRSEGLKAMRKVATVKERLLSEISRLQALIESIPSEPITISKEARIEPNKNLQPGRVIRLAPPVQRPELESGAVGKCELAILRFLAAREGKPLSRAQIGAWTGYSVKSSAFNGALSMLVKSGIIGRVSGKYVVDSARRSIVLDLLGSNYEEPPRSLEDWVGKLSPTPAKILQLILAHPAKHFSRQEIAERTGYSTSSSSFNSAISELCSLELMRRGHEGFCLNPDLEEVSA